MEQKPREEAEKMIKGSDLRGLFEKATEFHGHYCHKVAYGVKASLVAMKELGIESMGEEHGRIVALVDSPGPFCNGIQSVLGLTLAHSDFVVRDMGKLALTLLKHDGSAVRVSLRPEFLDGFSKRNPELQPLLGGEIWHNTCPRGKGNASDHNRVDAVYHGKDGNKGKGRNGKDDGTDDGDGQGSGLKRA